eukprot:CAMPEP_0117448032 /NCGR_PEP_ID=MMETSP0759-20121206/7183_1 /TAXON_ID=63605 /ORGANISM="Percolomonas cosmopolitus, Strain WS" /LENGTH=270 /DNA_ID=CAMNT_0005240389 /DNA_START=148 /DNA_END=957 /DNA_ORIENTATION=+
MSSLLSKEISHFKTLASSWQNPNGPLYTLHRLNPTRLQYVRKFVQLNKGAVQQQHAQPQSHSTYYAPLVQNCLDIGSGAGIATKNLANWCENVTAMEPTEELIQYAPKMDNVTYVNGLVEELASQEGNRGKFDLVCALEVVEHVADLELFVKSISQVLQEGGTLVMSTLNRTNKSFWMGIIGAEYLSGIVPVGTHDWHQFVKPEELIQLLAKNGIEVVDVVGVIYNPITSEFRLDYDDVSVNYMLAARKVVKETKQEKELNERRSTSGSE